MEAWTCGCEMFGCFGGRTEVEYLQFGVDGIGKVDVHPEIWLLLLLAILVEKDLGDLSLPFSRALGAFYTFPNHQCFQKRTLCFHSAD